MADLTELLEWLMWYINSSWITNVTLTTLCVSETHLEVHEDPWPGVSLGLDVTQGGHQPVCGVRGPSSCELGEEPSRVRVQAEVRAGEHGELLPILDTITCQ